MEPQHERERERIPNAADERSRAAHGDHERSRDGDPGKSHHPRYELTSPLTTCTGHETDDTDEIPATSAQNSAPDRHENAAGPPPNPYNETRGVRTRRRGPS
jgi:hypothetical protein